MSQLSLYLSLPENSGVYLFKDKNNKIIYVGKAKDLKKRVSSYFTGNILDSKTKVLISNITSVDYVLTNSEIEAFLLEAKLIKKYRPFYNLKFIDDKFYPYIKISKSDVPYIVISRKKGDSNAIYYGPYPDVYSTRVVLKLLRRIFPFQSVINHPRRKCLYNHLNLCPCVSVFPENLTQYRKNIKKIESFLKGNKDKVIKELEKERNEYSKNEEFERARETQNKIYSINQITSSFYDPFYYEKDPDLYIKRIYKETASLKEILKKYFPYLTSLQRIECYDISNIQGKNATGSMVVFINGEESKSNYRRFKIKFKNTPDDYKMMQEILSRRFKHEGWEKPDLIVIDGGKGQISAAIEVLLKCGISIPLIGLAKKEETIVIPDFNNKKPVFFEEKLSKSTPGLNLLRRVRDEAHRFAISYHRILRKKQFNLDNKI